MIYSHAELFGNIVSEYIHDNLWPPKPDWPPNEFRYRSYARWAAEELLAAIANNPGQFYWPNDILTWLDEQIDELTQLSDGSDIFTAAIDAYECIGREFV